MTRVRYWVGIAGLCLLTLPAASSAYAQTSNYPAKAVTIISDAAPGAAPDVVARFIADGLRKIFGGRRPWSEIARAQTAACRPRRGRSRPRRLYVVFSGDVDIRGAADGRAQSAGEASARFSADRVWRLSADVRRGQFIAWRLDAAGTDRPC